MAQGYECESCGVLGLTKRQTFSVEVQPITGPGPDHEAYSVWFICQPCIARIVALMAPPSATPPTTAGPGGCADDDRR